jgi:hypothetical protein
MVLSKETILQATNKGMAVFRHYIPFTFQVGRNFLNPLYKDKHASCNVFFDRHNNYYRLKDFGNDDYSGDCFAFVGKLYGLDCNRPADFMQILEKVDIDLHLGLADGKDYKPLTIASASSKHTSAISTIQTSTSVPLKKGRPYNIIQKNFTQQGLFWWAQYGITEKMLLSFHVVSLSRFDSENREGKPFYFLSSEEEPMYGYVGKQHIKVYRPMSEIRFVQRGNIPEHFCFGLEQLPAKGDLLFVTGGEKDVMALAAHGFHAICFNSETSHIPPEIIHKLSYRFKHIVLLFDVDKTGLESSDIAQLVVSVNDVPLGTQGNLLCITGGEGTGKSNYVASIISGAIRQKGSKIDTLGITVSENLHKKAVLFYDTEQSEVQLYKNINNLLLRCKRLTMPGYLHAYCLTGMSRKERLQAIVQSMDKYHYQ